MENEENNNSLIHSNIKVVDSQRGTIQKKSNIPLLKQIEEEWEIRKANLNRLMSDNLDKGKEYFAKLIISENNIKNFSNYKYSIMDNYLKELQQRNKELDDEINQKVEENSKYEEELDRLNEESIELKNKLNEYKEGINKIKNNLNKMNEDYINKLKEEKLKNEKKNQNLKKELNLLMNLTKFRIINAESYENGNKVKGFFINQEKNQIKGTECIITENNSIERHINFWKNLKEFLEN